MERKDHSKMTPAESDLYRKQLARERNKAYRARHPDREKARREQRADKMKEYQKEWYKKNKDTHLERQKVYYENNKQAVLDYHKKYYQENREELLKEMIERNAHLSATSPEYKAARSKAVVKCYDKRRRNDPVFRLITNLRRRINGCVKTRSTRTMALTGCSPVELRAHLESLFEPWMNWDNYGMGDGFWVIDHNKPCASFDLTDLEQQKLCFHYSNLKPMCWRANMLKSDSTDHLPVT